MKLQGRNLSIDMQGDDVKVLHTELRQLGFAIPDEELEKSFFGDGTRDVVLRLQEKNRLRPTGEVDERTAKVINALVDALPPPDVPRKAFIVHGQVLQAGKKPVAGVQVIAFDKDLRSEEQLGNVITDAGGNYEIRYSTEDFKRAEKSAADLRVAALRADGSEQSSSDIFYNAAPDQLVNLEITEAVPQPSSEYERYLAALKPVLQDVTLIDIDRQTPELKDKDLDFLAGDTGIDRQHIAWLVQAGECEEKSKTIDPTIRTHVVSRSIPAAMFYGWFRLGLPTDLQTLLSLPKATLFTTIKAAAEQRIVPSIVSEDLDGIGGQIERNERDRVLQSPRTGTLATLGDVLATLPAPLQLEQQHAIAAILPELHLDDPQLVKQIAGVVGSEDEAIGVSRALRLDELTLGHLPLAQALQPRLAEDSEGRLRPLASLRPDEWLDLVYTHRTPADSTSPVAYADALAAGVERQHPTAALTAHFSDGRRLAQLPALTEVGTFLLNNPGFDIVTANLNMPIQKAELSGVTEPDKLVDGLRTLQRMNMLGARWHEAAALMETGLDNPQKILDAGPGQLNALLDGQLTPERVTELHARAEDLFTNTFAAFTAAMSPFSAPRIMPAYFISGGGVTDPPEPGSPGGFGPLDPQVESSITFVRPDLSVVPRLPEPVVGQVIPDSRPVPDFIKDAITNQPTLQALFGSQASCACGHCNSVLSPAAYFVDVLQFLKNAGVLGEVSGNSGLLALRPDLQDLELSCNNTNTELPAIDLALEILENAVALPLDVPLQPGTNVDEQLISGSPVGDAVKTALEKTVRDPLGELEAKFENGAWTVVDGYRRWSLTARKEDGLWAETATQPLNLAGLKLSEVVAALDEKRIAESAKAAFLKLFSANASSELADYKVTIAPEVTGQSWRVSYRSVAQLLLNSRGNQLTLQTADGKTWLEREYDARTIAQMRSELENEKTVPALVQELLGRKFSRTTKLTLDGGRNAWTIQSPERELTLQFKPAQITIASLTYQSGDPTVDAIACPENHNPAAYAKLKGKDTVFPWSLPVDLPLEEVRLFLGRARCSRRRLLELMQLPGDDAVVAREVLGLCEAEAKLIEQQSPAPDEVYASWGLSPSSKSIWDAAAGADFQANSPLELLRNVSILLQQSRLTFEELQTVLTSRFVSSVKGDPLAITPLDTCIPSKMRLNALTSEHLDRIHRFVRLQRRLGWSFEDLDSAIQIAPGAVLDLTTVLWLANVGRLRELLGLPVEKIVVLFMSITSIEDRMTTLARALALTSGELEHARLLFDISLANLFASPGDVLEFCGQVKKFGRAGLRFEDLRYLLQHHEAPGLDAPLDEKQLTRLVNAVRDAVRSIPDAREEPASQPSNSETVEAAVAIRRNREDAIVAALATSLGAARDLVDDLLRSRLRHRSDSGNAAIVVFLDPSFLTSQPLAVATKSTLVRLHKTVFVCSALKLSQVDLKSLLKSGLIAGAPAVPDFGLTALDFNSLPTEAVAAPTPADTEKFQQLLKSFEQLVALVQLRTIAPGAADLMHHYAALDPAGTKYVENAQRLLAVGLLGSDDVKEVNDAARQLGMTSDQYADPIVLTCLIELLAALKQVGATVEEAARLVAASPDDAAALTARELLRSKYGDLSWHDLIKPIADKLRMRQRDALVDYLIAGSLREGPPRPAGVVGPRRLRDANDLYEAYLIDVQTNSDVKTTRLLQATATAQLFVQRLLLNLGGPVTLSDDKRELWEWMHRYRVWEANRKVFLFPENWLQPELRDDKTATFRQLESALTEQEPSPEITRAALLGYVEELADLAQISVIAMYQDNRSVKDKDGKDVVDSILYIVGRAPDQPYRYFWRSCAKFGDDKAMSWSGWEALDLDNANDFIMPFVFEGDLHIAWPIFHRKKEETQDQKNDGKLLWEVQLAWTRRTNNGWLKRKIGKAQFANVERLPNKDEAASFEFEFRKVDSQLRFSNNGKSLTREMVNIDCYAAVDSGAKSSMQPDPSKLTDSSPTGSGSRLAPNQQWNVSCKVEGFVYKYVDLGEQQGGLFYQGWGGIPVTLEASRQIHENQTDNTMQLPPFSTQTTDDGHFQFDIPTPDHVPKNGNEGVQNGEEITITFAIPGHAVIKDRRLVDQTDPTNKKFFTNWTWNINAGVEDKSLLNLFREERPVKYENVGAFIFQTGKDLSRIETPKTIPRTLRDKTKYNSRVPVPVVNPWLSIVLATQSPGPVEPSAWYVEDADGGAYLQKRNTSWLRWPDGQPFASSYRIAATLSTDSLFQPTIEANVHFDSLANNFLRQFPYANYNWELFLHTPLAIADYLARQQRFEDARRWLHAVFDPTTQPNNSGVLEFWRFLKFRDDTQPDAIAQLLTWLADPKTGDEKVEKGLSKQIEDWKKNPFMPHLVARLRPSAYQWHTFFAYLDVLIGWGDQQFRRDTRESINEATLLYVLAAKLLGPRPRVIPAPAPPPAQTYRSLKANGLDEFGNAWLSYFDLPGMKKLSSSQSSATTLRSSTQQAATAASGPTTGVAIERPPRPPKTLLVSLSSLAFCIPQNERLTEFYDRIEDRLFKVRNSRNIEGVFRDLPLFEPPIDPLLLIRARAAGLDIDSVITGLYAPLPHYRFTFTLQKAFDLAGELKALGGALLAALEKKDAEDLTLLRSSHEIAMLKLVSDTRKQQKAEAEANIVALQQSEAMIKERFAQYQKLLGKPGITMGQDGLPVVEQSSSLSVSTDPVGGVSGMGLSRLEVSQLILSALAHHFTQMANSGHVVAGVLSLVPNFTAGTPFASSSFGGLFLGSAASATAKAIEMGATEANFLANQAGVFGGYERRQDEWVHQSKLALAELKQIGKQMIAAEIRKEIADLELRNHEKQIENAEQVDEFMRSKFTNQQLYRWVSSQIAEVYFRTYQLALDQARRAEHGYQYELGLETSTAQFVRAGYWDNLKKGLMAGEQLHLDLRRMEVAYLDQNKREYEITRHVSLISLDPSALIALRQSGKCEVAIPEALFDLDYPGHYLRRIKSISVTVPCVTGPYTGVSCTITLLKSSVRRGTGVSAGYDRKTADDSRFVDSFGAIQSVVTSSGQNDGGLFETTLRDERYLPFEGHGVISTWRLELPDEFRAFNYDTISDVIFHIRYTARDGGETLKTSARADLRSALNKIVRAGNEQGFARLFSLKQEFPSEWHRLTGTGTAGVMSADFVITKNRFPFLFGNKDITIKNVSLYAVPTPRAQQRTFPLLKVFVPKNATEVSLSDTSVGSLPGKTFTADVVVAAGDADAKWKFETPNAVEFQQVVDDILMVCHYTLA